MKILLTAITALFVTSLALAQGCTLTNSNLTQLTGDDGSGNCSYSIDILFVEGSGPDNGDLTFTSSNATIFTGAGPHSCACTGNTYTLTFQAPCNSTVTFDVNHDNSGNGNDCSVTSEPVSLPVRWLAIELYDRKNNIVEVFWSTAAEVNNDHFEIQYSTSGEDFVSVTNVDGAGNSNVQTDYNYAHTQQPNTTGYYRIKQVDYDGNFSYSEIHSISTSSAIDISVFPNPVQETLYVSVSDETAVIHILDITGRILLSTSQKEIDLTAFRAGLYTIRIDTSSGSESRQFVKAM